MIRRHAIVHGTSFSSHEYWRKRASIKNLAPADKSERVDDPSAKYIAHAWEVANTVGVVAAHATLHRIGRTSKSGEQKRERAEIADNFLTAAAYECIRMGRHASAESILRYYLNDHAASADSDTYRLMAKVNLAQSLKWSQREDEAKQELDRIDVTSLNVQFQLCVAALREDEALFQKLLPRAVAEELVSIPDLLEWPVFRAMRKKSDFKQWVARAFGVELEAITQSRAAPLVLGPTPDKFETVFKKIMASADALKVKHNTNPEAEGLASPTTGAGPALPMPNSQEGTKST